MKLALGKRTFMLGTVTTLVVGAIGIALITAGGIVGWEYSNSNAFCTNMCHAVHPEEPVAHAASFHARVNCVECHMGRVSTLQLMAIKPTHINELIGMITGYERPTSTHSLRPARVSCEACHWPEARHDDTIRVKYRYESDPKSLLSKTTLQMHTGTGPADASGSKDTGVQLRGGGVTKGIHWHIAQEVDYVALDAEKQKIALIEIKGPDGKIKNTYFDPTVKLSRAEVEKMPRRRMDCIDCHNAVGHPFTNPSNLVDSALEQGLIDKSLPSVKARSEDIIKKAAGVGGEEKERAAKFAKIIADSAPKGDAAPKAREAEKKFADQMQQILLLTSFSGEVKGKALTWKDFPNNVGHKDFPGCFRCHDGKHLNEKQEAVRLQCTLCHALPVVEKESGGHSVASTVAPGLEPPDTHNAPNWMHEHRSKVDDSCAACHGPTKYGQDGGNFCANPACHGRRWPELDLDAQPAPPPAPAAPAKAAKVTATPAKTAATKAVEPSAKNVSAEQAPK